MGTLILIWMSLALHLTGAIKTMVYDCAHDEIKITRIAANQVAECVKDKQNLYTEQKMIQIIHEKKVENIKVIHCLIEKISIIAHCGHLSHSSLVDKGLSSTVIELTASECTDIHVSHRYTFKGTLFEDLKSNTTSDQQVTEVGSILADGTCNGVDFTQNGYNYDDAVVLSTLRITLSDYITTIDTTTQAVTFSDGSSCKGSIGTCFSHTLGTSVWNFSNNEKCSKTSRDILFEGLAFITSPSQLNGSNDLKIGDMVSVETNEKMMSFSVTGATHLCFQMVFKTDVDRILIAVKNPVFGFYFEMHEDIIPQNIDLPLYLNAKIFYLASQFKTKMEDLYREVKFAACQNSRQNILTRLQLARQNEVTYSHILNGKQGYMTLVAGDCLLSIKCIPMLVEVRETTTCHKNLPVLYNNRSTFMETLGCTLTDVPAEIPCSRVASAVFQVNNKVWISVNPHISYAQEPVVLQPESYIQDLKFGNIKRYLLAGIYSSEQLEAFNDYVRYPMRIRTANEYITNKFVQTHAVNDQFKITNMLSPEELKKMKDNFLEDVEAKILKFGSWMGAITGIILLAQIVRFLISTLINVQFLRSTLGNGFHLLAATFTSLTNLLVRNNVAAAEKQEQEMTAKQLQMLSA